MSADGGERTSSRVERVLALRSFSGLSDVDSTHLGLMAEVARERAFERGSVLMAPGEPARAVHFVRRGTVAVLRDGVTMRRYGQGDVVGAIAVFSRDPAGQHVVAEDEVRTFEISRGEMEDVVEESFPILLASLRGMMRTALSLRRELTQSAGYGPPPPETDRGPLGDDLVEHILFARRLLTYGRARVEALTELTRAMVRFEAPAGTVLWHEDDPSHDSLLLFSGTVRCATRSGQEFRFGADSVIGGIDSIAGVPRWYGATAETDVVGLRGRAETLFDVLEDHPDMGIDMLSTAARVLMRLFEERDRAVGPRP